MPSSSRLPVFPTPTLASNPFPASADHIVFLVLSRAEQAFSCRSPPPPPTFCCQEKLVTKNKTTGRRGRRGRKVVPGWPSPALIPFDVQGVALPGVRGRVGAWPVRAPYGWPLPSADGAREARRGAAVPTRSPAFPPQSPPEASAGGCSKVLSFSLKTKS